MHRPVILSIILLVLFSAACRSQDTLSWVEGYERPQPSEARRITSIGLVGAVSLSIAVDSYYTWWKDVAKPFSFYSEGWFHDAHLGMDKVGHLFGTYATYKILHNILLWGGHEKSTAMWWAAGIAAFQSLETEIGDGFSPYGFSFEDFSMGLLGVGYGMIQSEVPVLQNFNFKFSYWTDLGVRTPANFVSDYDAMTIWLTANVHNLLPEAIQPYWPEFLHIAVGYGVDGEATRREFVFGFDFDLESLFTPKSDHLLLVQRIVNTMHLPAPAVKFTTGLPPKYYLFHFR
jgi:hypothetical protein